MSAALKVRARLPRRGFTLDVELSARAGEPLALVGRSGAGKTTLLRLVAGLLRSERGRISLGDETWLDSERSIDVPSERRRCGLVFQDYALFGCMSVWRNVAYGVRGPRARRRAIAMEMLERFDLGGLAAARPAALSGGERQRVALARALAARPRALLLDEPLSALDRVTRERAVVELRAVLGELEVPTILVTHSSEDTAALASRVAVLERGALVEERGATETRANRRSPVPLAPSPLRC